MSKNGTSSSLRAQLEFLAPDNPALDRLIRAGLPLTEAHYRQINWLPDHDDIDDWELMHIELLRAYEAALKNEATS